MYDVSWQNNLSLYVLTLQPKVCRVLPHARKIDRMQAVQAPALLRNLGNTPAKAMITSDIALELQQGGQVLAEQSTQSCAYWRLAGAYELQQMREQVL